MSTVVRLEQFQPRAAAPLAELRRTEMEHFRDPEISSTPALPRTRGALCTWLKRCAAAAGADGYMLLDLTTTLRIVASSWSFDAIHALGDALLARLVEPSIAPFLGAMPTVWRTGENPAGIEASILHELGFAELASTRLRIADAVYCLIISSTEDGAIRERAVPSAKLTATYALSHMADHLTQPLPEDPLSERERECLYWVAEGKTTDEVSTIISVSANTVNSYLGCAMRKLAAANRTMAVAAAIRGGII